jgi:hypothetical protein
MVKFILYLTSNFVNNSEDIKIGIDNQLLLETTLLVNKIEFDAALNDGEHLLWIELCGKTLENETRENGILIEDTFINIQNISINNSMMNHLLNDNGYIIPDWTHHADVARWFEENNGSVPDRLEHSKYLNLKGKYYFSFSLPIKEYMNKHIPIHPAYTNLYNISMERFSKLEDRLTKK